MTTKFMTDPVRVLLKRDELSLDGIRNFFVAVEKEEFKMETLFDLYESISVAQACVFVNQRKKVSPANIVARAQVKSWAD